MPERLKERVNYNDGGTGLFWRHARARCSSLRHTCVDLKESDHCAIVGCDSADCQLDWIQFDEYLYLGKDSSGCGRGNSIIAYSSHQGVRPVSLGVVELWPQVQTTKAEERILPQTENTVLEFTADSEKRSAFTLRLRVFHEHISGLEDSDALKRRPGKNQMPRAVMHPNRRYDPRKDASEQ